LGFASTERADPDAREANMSVTNRTKILFGAAAVALGGCETVNRVANDVVANNFAATLSGANEVPLGDGDGSGTASISLNDATNQVCTRLEVRNIGDVTAAHIHRGAAGVNGPPVIPLDAPDDNDSNDCDTVEDSLLDELRRSPANFYVNVHTSQFPNGAIRGQIMDVRN
jgi:hypothetical protein